MISNQSCILDEPITYRRNEFVQYILLGHTLYAKNLTDDNIEALLNKKSSLMQKLFRDVITSAVAVDDTS